MGTTRCRAWHCSSSPGAAVSPRARRSGGPWRSGLSASRPALMCAAVEIHRATGDITAARESSDELSAIAERSSSELLTAMAAQATGSVLLAAGVVTAALPALRAAATAWRAAHMPYDVARTAVLLALACAALGDRIGAEVEFDTARAIFGELGAAPDVARVERLVAGLGDDGGRRDESRTYRPVNSRCWLTWRRADQLTDRRASRR